MKFEDEISTGRSRAMLTKKKQLFGSPTFETRPILTSGFDRGREPETSRSSCRTFYCVNPEVQASRIWSFRMFR